MKNNIVSLTNRELLQLGEAASAGALALGREVGLVINKQSSINDDTLASGAAVRAYQTEVANRVPKAAMFAQALLDARTWCFRAKETLKPFLAESHSSVWRPTGFVTSLSVPREYSGLLALVGTLAQYLAEHPDQTNNGDKFNVTATRALELVEALRTAKGDLDAQDALIDTRHQAQDEALDALRNRLRGLIGELKQLIGLENRRWRRFGLNIPAEPETSPQPDEVQVNNTIPGQLLVSCTPVAFAER
jgi:hypothetical protein